MALINRISRLFKADFHAVLDQIEEPEALLRQAIRDMEDDLASATQRINLCEHDQEVLAARKTELEDAVREFEIKLDLCFESEKEDLARTVIRRRLEAESRLKRLNAKQIANAKYLTEQRSVLDQNSATLESLRQKAELFAQQTPAHTGDSTDFDDTAWLTREMVVGEDEVEIAFLSEKNSRSAS